MNKTRRRRIVKEAGFSAIELLNYDSYTVSLVGNFFLEDIFTKPMFGFFFFFFAFVHIDDSDESESNDDDEEEIDVVSIQSAPLASHAHNATNVANGQQQLQQMQMQRAHQRSLTSHTASSQRSLLKSKNSLKTAAHKQRKQKNAGTVANVSVTNNALPTPVTPYLLTPASSPQPAGNPIGPTEYPMPKVRAYALDAFDRTVKLCV